MKINTVKHWGLALCVSAALASLNGCGQPVNQQSSESAQIAGNASAQSDVFAANANLFDLQQVRITDGPFAHAMHTNVNYLLAMEPERLLAPYLREAGLKPKADSYGNWEDTGLDGHIGGHYLSALSLGYAATGGPALLDRLEYMLDQL